MEHMSVARVVSTEVFVNCTMTLSSCPFTPHLIVCTVPDLPQAPCTGFRGSVDKQKSTQHASVLPT